MHTLQISSYSIARFVSFFISLAKLSDVTLLNISHLSVPGSLFFGPQTLSRKFNMVSLADGLRRDETEFGWKLWEAHYQQPASDPINLSYNRSTWESLDRLLWACSSLRVSQSLTQDTVKQFDVKCQASIDAMCELYEGDWSFLSQGIHSRLFFFCSIRVWFMCGGRSLLIRQICNFPSFYYVCIFSKRNSCLPKTGISTKMNKANRTFHFIRFANTFFFTQNYKIVSLAI